MNRRTAEEKGYRFTGFYKRDKEEIKNEKKIKFTSLGYKSVIVTIPDSPYSRSACIGVGYSVYAEQKYFDDRRRKDLQRCFQAIPIRRKNAKKDYEETLKKIEIDVLNYQEELNSLNKK